MSQSQHGPVSENRIREEMGSHPSWMVDNAVQWTRGQEARGHEFTGAQAAVRSYIGDMGRSGAAGGDFGGAANEG